MLPTLSRRLERKNMTHAVAFSRFASVFSDDCLTTKPSGRSNETFVVPILIAFGVATQAAETKVRDASRAADRRIDFMRGIFTEDR
jgi:hypothetical protein